VATPSRGGDRSYHHGNVRPAIIQAALDEVAAGGLDALAIRSLARRVGVTHAAVLHHFGDKAGVLTAVAADGYRILATYLEAAAVAGDFGDVGVAYVRFAVSHPAHFDVMFRPGLLRLDDAELNDARARAAGVLYGSARQVSDAAGGDEVLAGVAGWAYVHGVATLWRDGNLPPPFGDPVDLAERLTPLLFQSSATNRRRARRARGSKQAP
jgi:AcrR family transcriptional regulator